MRYLLDTNALIWWRRSDPRFSEQAQRAMSDQASDVFVSVVSAWEIAIKLSIGRISLPAPLHIWFADALREDALVELPIVSGHAVELENLPYHHRDPFDRMLVAQATVEKMTIVTSDQKLMQYDVPILRL